MTEIQNIPISKLNLSDKNPRKITKAQLESLARSLERDPDFLYRRPILANQKDKIITVYAGNQRVRAAKRLGLKTIPCIIDENLDENTITDRTICDNKTFGEWDWDCLANDFDFEVLLINGFTADELVGLSKEAECDEDSNSKDGKSNKIKTCPHCGEKL